MLADKFGKPLFEVRPDLFPHGRLTGIEISLWEIHLKEQEKRHGKQ